MKGSLLLRRVFTVSVLLAASTLATGDSRPAALDADSSGSIAQASANRPPWVRALLQRSRLLKNVHFQVPRGVYREFRRQQLDPSPSGPVGYIPAAATYELTIDSQGRTSADVTLTINVLDGHDAGSIAVLSDKLVWKDLTVRTAGGPARPIDLATADGFLQYQPDREGVVELKARTDEFGRGNANGGQANWPVLPTVVTQVKVRSDAPWEVFLKQPQQPQQSQQSQQSQNSQTTQTLRESREAGDASAQPLIAPADGKTVGAAYVPSRRVISLHWRRPRPHYRRPGRFLVSGHVAWDFQATEQRLTARLVTTNIGGPVSRLELSLPAGAENVSISGPHVREVQVTADRATVYFRGEINGRTLLNVSLRRTGTGGRTTLSGLSVASGHWTGGTVILADSEADRELLATDASGLTRRTLVGLASSASSLASGDIVGAWRITGRRWSLSSESVTLSQLAIRESIADLAHYKLTVRPDGRMMTVATFEVRNRTGQYMTVRLPRRSHVLLARVNEESRPLSPTGRDDEYLLPLIRSDASIKGLVSFPVQIVYLSPLRDSADQGRLAVPLIEIDLPIAYAFGEMHWPKAWQVRRLAGPFQRVNRYSSQTATASMDYGTASLAEGYAAEDRLAAAESAYASGDPTAGAAAGKNEAKPAGTTARSKAVLGYMGYNYWRTGQSYYREGKFDDAERALSNARKFAPDRSIRTNADRLLSNIAVLRGERSEQQMAEDDDKSSRALAKALRKGGQARNINVATRQFEVLDRGRKALAEGKEAQAQQYLQQAEVYNRRLIEQGADVREQDALLSQSRVELDRLNRKQLDKARRLSRKARELEEKGQYEEALKAVKQAQQAQSSVKTDIGASVRSKIQAGNRRIESSRIHRSQTQAPDEPGQPNAAPGSAGDLEPLGGFSDFKSKLAAQSARARALDQRLKRLARQLGKDTAGIDRTDGIEDKLSLIDRYEADLTRRDDEMNQIRRQPVQAQPELRDVQALTAPGEPLRQEERRIEGHVTQTSRTRLGLRQQEVPWYRQITYPRDWPSTQDGRFAGRAERFGFFGTGGSPEALLARERDDGWSYLAKRPATDAPTDGKTEPVTRSYDVRDLTLGGAVAAGQSPSDFASAKRNQIARLVSILRQATGVPATTTPSPNDGKPAIWLTEGQLIVRGDADVHASTRRVVGRFRRDLGPQIDIPAFETPGLDVSEPQGEIAANEGADLSDSDEFREFVAGNYSWTRLDQAETFAGNLQPVETTSSQGDGRGQPAISYTLDDLAGRLELNRGLKTKVSSWNINVSARRAEQVGASFIRGNSGLRFATVDEAQLRTLMDLELDLRGQSLAQYQQNFQDTIIGTDAWLANSMTANPSRATAEGNVLTINDNPISLEHEQFVLIDNGGTLTAVAASKLARWDTPIAPIVVAASPQTIDIPRIGRVIRFEKKLINPQDRLVLEIRYEPKGD
ncbi:MAG: hypothetical protein KGY81_03290 [Phycisphaerae bacterium]|nr:hypothetical protein [Phycisphaerae bacterium]